MARQKSVIKVEGTLDDLTFYKSKDGYLVRKKGGLNKDRIQNDPAFARTRENGSEFGRAGKSGKLLRSAFTRLISKTRDSRMVTRLQRQLLAVIKTDSSSARGERSAQLGDLELLEGFEFNDQAQLGNSLALGFAVALDRVSGAVTVSLPDFIPLDDVAYPSGASHLRVVCAAAEVNFDDNLQNGSATETAWLPVDGNLVAAQDLTVNLSANSTENVFTVLGIEFGQEVNGQVYPLSSGNKNALALVDVDLN